MRRCQDSVKVHSLKINVFYKVKQSKQCCRIIFLYSVDMYSTHWLIKTVLLPLTMQSKIRWKSQIKKIQREGQSHIDEGRLPEKLEARKQVKSQSQVPKSRLIN